MKMKCCFVLAKVIVRTWWCCFITQYLVNTLLNGWRMEIGVTARFCAAQKWLNSNREFPQLCREESVGNLDFRRCKFSVEREFRIQHLQVAQKILHLIFVPGKHKAALWKCFGNLAASGVVWVCFLSPEHLIRCFTLEPLCRHAVVKHFSCWLKGMMSEKGVSYRLYWLFLYTK